MKQTQDMCTVKLSQKLLADIRAMHTSFNKMAHMQNHISSSTLLERDHCDVLQSRKRHLIRMKEDKQCGILKWSSIFALIKSFTYLDEQHINIGRKLINF